MLDNLIWPDLPHVNICTGDIDHTHTIRLILVIYTCLLKIRRKCTFNRLIVISGLV